MQARNEEYSDAKNINIAIADAEEEEKETDNIGFTGLFALGEGLAIGGLMLIVLIIASILLVKIFKTPQEKEDRGITREFSSFCHLLDVSPKQAQENLKNIHPCIVYLGELDSSSLQRSRNYRDV